MKIEIDPEFRSLIPPLSDEEYQQLEENLLSDGCRDSLVIWGNILIDGHNRLAICEKHNLPYNVEQRDFTCREHAIQYIICNQIGRRNLSQADRCILVLKLEPLYSKQAKQNLKLSRGRGKKGLTNSSNLFTGTYVRKELADLARVSENTIQKVRRIVQDGTPEQIERIRKGGRGDSINAVYKEVWQPEKPDGAVDCTAASPSSDGGYEEQEEKTGALALGVPVSGTPNANPGLPAPLTEQDELARIRGYVAELKNPNLNRSFTTEMKLWSASATTATTSWMVRIGSPHSVI